MFIIARYSFNRGIDFIRANHSKELEEVEEIISQVDASVLRTKISKEKTMMGKELYSPKRLNTTFSKLFKEKSWQTVRINMSTTIPEIGQTHTGFREMDYVKNKLGVEVQFGKYAFMVYNVSAKMTIFARQGIIDSGIEIVPMLSLASEMSTGVSYFEQIKSDLEYRGVSNIDIPVLVIGIDAEASRPSFSFSLKEWMEKNR
jgi:hypothetical protein